MLTNKEKLRLFSEFTSMTQEVMAEKLAEVKGVVDSLEARLSALESAKRKPAAKKTEDAA